jgi:hypothetical protein
MTHGWILTCSQWYHSIQSLHVVCLSKIYWLEMFVGKEYILFALHLCFLYDCNNGCTKLPIMPIDWVVLSLLFSQANYHCCKIFSCQVDEYQHAPNRGYDNRSWSLFSYIIISHALSSLNILLGNFNCRTIHSICNYVYDCRKLLIVIILWVVLSLLW